MSTLQSTEIINGEEITILIESNLPAESSERTRSTRGVGDVVQNVVQQSKGAFSSGVDLIRHCAAQVVTGVQNLDDNLKPEEIEVQLAIKLGSAAGAVLVSLSSEAQLQVKLKWKLKSS
jgi:hypothetical protein